MTLVRYNEIKESAYIEYISEWENEGKTIVPGASDRKGRAFEEMMIKWISNEEDIMYEKGLVPSTLYFLISTGLIPRSLLRLVEYKNERIYT